MRFDASIVVRDEYGIRDVTRDQRHQVHQRDQRRLLADRFQP